MKIIELLNKTAGYLPALFWLLLIYSFDSPEVANLTILAALIHECGHIFYLFLTSKNIKLRGSFNGFRIKRSTGSSYMSDIYLYAAGALMNFLVAFPIILFSASDYVRVFAFINIATAVANLLPIYGYDGYGILKSLILMKDKDAIMTRHLDALSFSLTLLTTLLAFYIMARIGDSFWLGGLSLFSLIKEVSRGLDNVF